MKIYRQFLRHITIISNRSQYIGFHIVQDPLCHVASHDALETVADDGIDHAYVRYATATRRS